MAEYFGFIPILQHRLNSWRNRFSSTALFPIGCFLNAVIGTYSNLDPHGKIRIDRYLNLYKVPILMEVA